MLVNLLTPLRGIEVRVAPGMASCLCLNDKLGFLVHRDVIRAQKVAIVCSVWSHQVKLVIWLRFRASRPFHTLQNVFTECRKASHGYGCDQTVSFWEIWKNRVLWSGVEYCIGCYTQGPRSVFRKHTYFRYLRCTSSKYQVFSITRIMTEL